MSILGLACLGFLWKGFWWLLLTETVVYSLGLIFGIFDVARKVSWRYSPISPLIFMLLHFGYGFGSMWGIIRFVLLGGRAMVKPKDARLSR
jgi:hypothetical protein